MDPSYSTKTGAVAIKLFLSSAKNRANLSKKKKSLLVGRLPRAISWTHMPVWLIHRWKLAPQSPLYSDQVGSMFVLCFCWLIYRACVGCNIQNSISDLYSPHHCCSWSMINGRRGRPQSPVLTNDEAFSLFAYSTCSPVYIAVQSSLSQPGRNPYICDW